MYFSSQKRFQPPYKGPARISHALTQPSSPVTFDDYDDFERSPPRPRPPFLQFDQGQTSPDQPFLLQGMNQPNGSSDSFQHLKPVSILPDRFQRIFSFPFFNIAQSAVLDSVYFSDKPVVICSPTGSGKTVIFELAIIRLLDQIPDSDVSNTKIIYMAPTKALCTERTTDWLPKFEPFGLKVKEVTGDTDDSDLVNLQDGNLIITTPEKWDSVTRRWRDRKTLLQMIKLFLVDEIHILGSTKRGATVEAVISRMKTIHNRNAQVESESPIRFLAASATIPNPDDIAQWLNTNTMHSATHFKLGDEYRPVRLNKVVRGYNTSGNTGFRFDINLNYKLPAIIQEFSEGKPTLVFCSTRKSVLMAANTLSNDVSFSMSRSRNSNDDLRAAANQIQDEKLRSCLLKGVGFHHAGVQLTDRRIVEAIFLSGKLPVVMATSTLAIGVNFPAHLVIVKSTQFYDSGTVAEYSDTDILQMIGRAGRPQFDRSATAVIMTRMETRQRYENLLSGNTVIESCLNQNLVEHLNAEIVLEAVTDVAMAFNWLKSTFFYIRVLKNPRYYGLPAHYSTAQIEEHLEQVCFQSLNSLVEFKLAEMEGNDATASVKSTNAGRLMARYYIRFDTVKLFNSSIRGNESLAQLLQLITESEEFSDTILRTNERKTLNTLNKDKQHATIRFPMQGKIKTKQMKVSCLMQAQLGCLPVTDFGLASDVVRIFKSAVRVAKFLQESVWQTGNYTTLLHTTLLSKCAKAQLWENSSFVSRQLNGIGPALSSMLVNAEKTSFEKILATNPRDLEVIMNRHPPFGKTIVDEVRSLPKYEMKIEQVEPHANTKSKIQLSIQMLNWEDLRQNMKKKTQRQHSSVLLIGDSDNKVVYKWRLNDQLFIDAKGTWVKELEVRRASRSETLQCHLISQDKVGLDLNMTYTPFYTGAKNVAYARSFSSEPQNQPARNATNVAASYKNNNYPNPSASQCSQVKLKAPSTAPNKSSSYKAQCRHQCKNRYTCAHKCCKNGLPHNPNAMAALLPRRPTQPIDRNVQIQQHRQQPAAAAGNLRMMSLPTAPAQQQTSSHLQATQYRNAHGAQVQLAGGSQSFSGSNARAQAKGKYNFVSKRPAAQVIDSGELSEDLFEDDSFEEKLMDSYQPELKKQPPPPVVSHKKTVRKARSSNRDGNGQQKSRMRQMTLNESLVLGQRDNSFGSSSNSELNAIVDDDDDCIDDDMGGKKFANYSLMEEDTLRNTDPRRDFGQSSTDGYHNSHDSYDDDVVQGFANYSCDEHIDQRYPLSNDGLDPFCDINLSLGDIVDWPDDDPIVIEDTDDSLEHLHLDPPETEKPSDFLDIDFSSHLDEFDPLFDNLDQPDDESLAFQSEVPQLHCQPYDAFGEGMETARPRTKQSDTKPPKETVFHPMRSVQMHMNDFRRKVGGQFIGETIQFGNASTTSAASSISTVPPSSQPQAIATGFGSCDNLEIGRPRYINDTPRVHFHSTPRPLDLGSSSSNDVVAVPTSHETPALALQTPRFHCIKPVVKIEKKMNFLPPSRHLSEPPGSSSSLSHDDSLTETLDLLLPELQPNNTDDKADATDRKKPAASKRDPTLSESGRDSEETTSCSKKAKLDVSGSSSSTSDDSCPARDFISYQEGVIRMGRIKDATATLAVVGGGDDEERKKLEDDLIPEKEPRETVPGKEGEKEHSGTACNDSDELKEILGLSKKIELIPTGYVKADGTNLSESTTIQSDAGDDDDEGEEDTDDLTQAKAMYDRIFGNIF